MMLSSLVEQLTTLLNEEGDKIVVIYADHGQSPEPVTFIEEWYTADEYEGLYDEEEAEEYDDLFPVVVLYGQ